MARFRRARQGNLWGQGAAELGSRRAEAGAILSIYADSSFIVSLYVSDRHSNVARRLVKDRTRVWLTPLHRAEWTHAVAQAVYQQRISAGEAKAVSGQFERDRMSRVWVEVGLPEMAFERCVKLAEQYVARLNSGTLDTLHVASALELGAKEFWTFDDRQAKLARAVGLKL
jgi:predicted nucleic acid-binding protein